MPWISGILLANRCGIIQRVAKVYKHEAIWREKQSQMVEIFNYLPNRNFWNRGQIS